MSIFEIGRLCVKIAGRDTGLKCVVIDKVDDKYVLVDGETRRKTCNINHLEPLAETVSLSKNASHEEVEKVLAEKGITKRKTKPKKAAAKPGKKVAAKAATKTAAKETKKASTKKQ